MKKQFHKCRWFITCYIETKNAQLITHFSRGFFISSHLKYIETHTSINYFTHFSRGFLCLLPPRLICPLPQTPLVPIVTTCSKFE